MVRKRDLIIRGGQNIEPVEIEDHLLACPLVKQVAIVGVPDSIMGERVCAYIVPRDERQPTLEDLCAFLRRRGIAAFKLPERLEVLESLPMVSDTKVDKNALLARP